MTGGWLGFELRPRGHHSVPGRELVVGDRSVAFHSPDSARRSAWQNDATVAPMVSRSVPKDAAQRLRLPKHTTLISTSPLEPQSFAITLELVAKRTDPERWPILCPCLLLRIVSEHLLWGVAR